MNLIRILKIGTRLALGFGLLLVLVVAMAVIGVAGLHYMDKTIVAGERDNATQALAAYAMLAELNESALATRDQLLAADAGERAAAATRLDTARRRYIEAEQRLGALIKTDGSAAEREGLARIGQLQASVQPVAERLARALQNTRGGRADEARRILAAELTPRHAAWGAAVKDMVRQQDQDLKVIDEEAARAYALVRNILIVAAVAAVVLGVAAAWLLATSIVRPLEEAVAVAETVAAGDLSATIDLSGRDEPARLLQALARMTGALAAVVSKVRAGSDSIAQGTAQIANGNEDLAQRTEEQASNLQQTAASMEQLSSTVRSAADTAQQANALAASASQAAQQGGDVVDQVVQTMQGIQTSSRKVSEIIGVIDGIAFQTNILALNAAVEAARAGEHGRGFAVVATEVRALAQRSASAAREIKGLISDSVGKVESGSKLVGDAGRTMTDIVDQVRRVSLMIEQISSAASEQTLGISQVSEAVTQLDQVTQQNAALVEQLASAAGSLNSRSADLLGSVGTFRLPGGEPAAASPYSTASDAPTHTPAPASATAPTSPATASAAPDSAQKHSPAPRRPAAAAATATSAAADSAEWTQF